MKQLAQYQDGRLELQDVPAPMAPPGGVLVRTAFSVISPGTEKMKVEQARMSLLAKARARPDQVRKVLETARTLGWKAALAKVRNRLESPTPLGYSAAGVVVAVDDFNTRFRVGDRVAVGGAECAHHAEFVAVPDLLAAHVPDGVELWQAAYTTLAAISMQAVRQASAGVGERVMVVGVGLVGQLATSVLAAAGARVLGVDVNDARLTTALAMGAERVVNPKSANVEDTVREWSGGMGVDAVLLCIGGAGNGAAVAQAVACLRDRGTLVIVGMHDAQLEWKQCYMKDITVRYSRSYGPGRYDDEYEWAGRDYPAGYVRWTENRNFESCLHLMQTGALKLEPVTTRRAVFADAVSVYDELMRAWNADVGVVLEYGVEACRTGILPVSGEAGILPDAAAMVGTRGDGVAGRMPAALATGRMPVLPGTGETPVLLDRSFVAYNPLKKTEKARRHLPHWEQPGVTQFVTIQLADAIPQEQLRDWVSEREAWKARHPLPWDLETEELYHRLFSERMQQWLDAGAGSCLLAREEAASLVEGAMRHFDGERYVLDEYVIMPNHVHVLLKPLGEHALSGIMHSWKSFTAREIKKLYELGAGAVWQEERFDHAVRSVAGLMGKRGYIAGNPGKARLTSGFVLGRGLGVVVDKGGTGILPVSGEAGILPAATAMVGTRVDGLAGRMPSALATGRMPVLPGTGETPILQVIGAGNFVRTMLLPYLKGKIALGAVVNATGLSARHVREKFGFAAAETDAAKVVENTGSAVLIGTRHHLHAPLLLRALARDRHIFVEKPLCLTRAELSEIDTAVSATKGSVMVGFNRRFAPATLALMKALAACPGPKTLAFHVNAGPLAPNHWYANVEESGGRVLGEACHFFDYACCVLKAKPVRVMAQSLASTDAMSAQVEFDDSSSAQIIYSAEGDSAFPKETCRVFASGLVAEVENFQRLRLYRNRKALVTKFSSKGHAEEMAAWLAFLKGEAVHPLPYAEARQSMALTFAALESMRERRAVAL